ncbi:MAG: hypothetical protein PHS92_05245 [Candidatus Gracilibacteria bacterium]|nr:hypothetical protein [Candidatus Gracilibacteria bacterium]
MEINRVIEEQIDHHGGAEAVYVDGSKVIGYIEEAHERKINLILSAGENR